MERVQHAQRANVVDIDGHVRVEDDRHCRAGVGHLGWRDWSPTAPWTGMPPPTRSPLPVLAPSRFRCRLTRLPASKRRNGPRARGGRAPEGRPRPRCKKYNSRAIRIEACRRTTAQSAVTVFARLRSRAKRTDRPDKASLLTASIIPCPVLCPPLPKASTMQRPSPLSMQPASFPGSPEETNEAVAPAAAGERPGPAPVRAAKRREARSLSSKELVSRLCSIS